MATSPNFSWPEPDNTDLVKNGALAIRTAINAIDTSMVDLKGGTTGQVLSKASATDMDFSWVTDATGIPATIFDAKGDIIAATAADTAGRLAVGTNGQTLVADSSTSTGLKWQADTVNTVIDAKGDLLAGTAADTIARLAVGANNTVLTADSAEATGLKWAAPASGSTFSGWLIYKTAAQSIANGTSTFMTWESETYDTDGYHSTVTNTSRVTIPAGKAGKYLLVANLGWANGTTGERYVHIYKGGAAVAGADNSNARNSFGNSGTQTQRCITVLDLAETNYVEVRVVQTSGGSLNTTADECNFIGYLIGA